VIVRKKDFMSQKKARRKKRPNQRQRHQRSRRKLTASIGSVLCLLLSGVIWARWRTQPATPSPTALAPLPQASSTPTPNPFVPRRAAKEYIYVGGKLQAVEEPVPPAGGSAFDFTGNGSGDAVVFRPSESNWYILDLATNSAKLDQFGAATDIIAPGDYDGDRQTDIAVWRPKSGTACNGCGWYVKQSSNGATSYYADWGLNDDVTVPADYDGDGKTDKAIWRPSEGNWYIIQSSKPSSDPDYTIHPNWGNSTDKPVPADYDGDGRADLAVFRPSEGNWYIKRSSNGTVQTQGWGASGDWLAPADYDGDGKADIAVWRPSEGTWYIRQSSNGTNRVVGWGQTGDKIVPADYDGDGRVDIAVWRPSEGNWYVKKSSDGLSLVRNWGAAGDKPVPAAFVREP
jgi:hypothetical protein